MGRRRVFALSRALLLVAKKKRDDERMPPNMKPPISDKDAKAYKVGDCICAEASPGFAYNGEVCVEHRAKAALTRHHMGFIDGLRKASEMLAVKAQRENDQSLWAIVSDINQEARDYAEKIKK